MGKVFIDTNIIVYAHDNKYPHKTEFIITGNGPQKEMVKQYETILPENPIKLMLSHPKKDLLYLITAKKIDDTRDRYIDAIYTLNTKNGKINKLREIYYNYKV